MDLGLSRARAQAFHRPPKPRHALLPRDEGRDGEEHGPVVAEPDAEACEACHGPVYRVLREQHAVERVRRVGWDRPDHVRRVDVLYRAHLAAALEVLLDDLADEASDGW